MRTTFGAGMALALALGTAPALGIPVGSRPGDVPGGTMEAGAFAARDGPVVGIESIEAVVTWDEPWEAAFPNWFDPLHPKDLNFTGAATLDGVDSGTYTLWLQFDWLDPSLGIIYSPAFPVDLMPGVATPVEYSWTVDFCPSQVSLHLATDAPTGSVALVTGTYTHQCRLPVSEPPELALLFAGLIGLARSWRPRPARQSAG